MEKVTNHDSSKAYIKRPGADSFELAHSLKPGIPTEEIAGLLQKEGLLIHACCGPCLAFPSQELLELGVRPSIFYYNPNIHPKAEWQKRYEGLVDLINIRKFDLYTDPLYGESDWLKYQDQATPCLLCYQARLDATAVKAKDLQLKYFTTSLLISPYQNREAIIAAGIRAAQKYDRIFWPVDWRDNFRPGQDEARNMGLYRQKYCGCTLSLADSKFYEKIIREQMEFKARPGTPEPIEAGVL